LMFSEKASSVNQASPEVFGFFKGIRELGLRKRWGARRLPGRLFLIRRSHLAIPWQVAPQQSLPPFHQISSPAYSRRNNFFDLTCLLFLWSWRIQFQKEFFVQLCKLLLCPDGKKFCSHYIEKSQVPCAMFNKGSYKWLGH